MEKITNLSKTKNKNLDNLINEARINLNNMEQTIPIIQMIKMINILQSLYENKNLYTQDELKSILNVLISNIDCYNQYDESHTLVKNAISLGIETLIIN